MRPIHALPVVLTAAALAGCGGGGGNDSGGGGGATGGASTATQTQSTTRATAPAKGPDGAQVFASAGCESCHTLSAAASSGNVGPNLDDLKPDFAAVQQQVENGGGGMPSFKGDLSQAEIDAVARYVSENAGQ
jgi:mono/diheme cytochrome c family protein